MPDKKLIGDRLRALRGRRSRATVADALGVTRMAVSLWERGLRIPRDEMKQRIADFYKKSVSSIFYK